MMQFMHSRLTQESLSQLDQSKIGDLDYLAEFTIQMAVRETIKPGSYSSMYNFRSTTIPGNRIRLHYIKNKIHLYRTSSFSKVKKEETLAKIEFKNNIKLPIRARKFLAHLSRRLTGELIG